MAGATPVRIVDIELSPFRIPPPPFWRSRLGPAVIFFGGLMLAFLLALGGGRGGAWLAITVGGTVIVGGLIVGLVGLFRVMRDRAQSSVAGQRLPFVRPEDLGRTPPGFDRTIGEAVAQVRAMEAGAPPAELIKRDVPPDVRRHAMAYQVGAGLVGVGFLLYLAVFHRAGALDVLLFMFAATALLTRGRRVMAQSASELISHDPRAPILFLRSFMDDRIKVKQWQRQLGLQIPFVLRFEEALGDMVGRYGPFLAIGEPDEGLPQLGAARAYPGEGEWQATVQAWIREARLIAMLCGPTRWVHWEVQNIVSAGRLGRLLLFLPPGRGAQVQGGRRRLDRWDNIVKSLEETPYGPAMRSLNIDDVLLIQFEPDRLNVFRSAGDMSQDYALAAALAASVAADSPSDDPVADDPDATQKIPVTPSRTQTPTPRSRAERTHDQGGRGVAPATLWPLLAGVGLVVGLLVLAMAGMRGGGRSALGMVTPFLFAGAVAGAIAVWGGHERGQWPRVLAALAGAAVLNMVLAPGIIRLLLALHLRGEGLGLLVFGFMTRAITPAALAIASPTFRSRAAWISGLGVAFLGAFLSVIAGGSDGPGRLLIILPPALTAGWIGYILARRTLT